ncbi:hypothetical protein SAMN02910340_02165 [Methanosarcina thermophila]|jgi:hypothetical protein|uniref:Uncharacterized protein n=1 Tax=Methanosarcina thermophila TaxID=2210 RepID=A0A1I7AJB8_METTE|nr:hypothetical protein [Methanosarcina thermophila]NLU57911.1 hypothetical protein [Methanosarcina thermophila]SFT75037.1 hypothetical protein SAMN02910340_02165 [Methanosarcina thermophila]HOA69699.1 hypothetical protein [Methanosarcina thermophila]HOQ66252.1 hypothetical protein [Methanosarcina thermophila]HPT81421.1 hypothetical protein [Methanosarcina thermophila]
MFSSYIMYNGAVYPKGSLLAYNLPGYIPYPVVNKIVGYKDSWVKKKKIACLGVIF